MFSIEWQTRADHISGRTGFITKKRENDLTPVRVCSVSTWGMGSCAVATLQRWGWMCRVSIDELDQFFEFICNNIDYDWKPNEFYFLLSDEQIKHQFKHLIKHPNVRLRDKFENKSHGPNRVYLYRYSKALDFKRVITKRS